MLRVSTNFGLASPSGGVLRSKSLLEVVEGGQAAHGAHHDGHWVCIVAEPLGESGWKARPRGKGGRADKMY